MFEALEFCEMFVDVLLGQSLVDFGRLRCSCLLASPPLARERFLARTSYAVTNDPIHAN
jgi:hypothetical protein